MKFEFGVAGREDDADIRDLLAQNPMPGSVSVAFEREPDYFLGHGVMGDRCLTLKATDLETGRLAGIISVAAADRYVGGKVRSVGYVGQIRIAREYRGYLMPMRAAAYLRSTVSSDWPDLWFSAIVHGNRSPQRMFVERPRASFPVLEPVSRIHTFGIFTRERYSRAGLAVAKSASHGSTTIRSGGDVGLAAIVSFLQSHGDSREFFPRYELSHFAGGDRTPGFQADDFVVAISDDTVVGVCGVWNQSSFRQTIVHGYSGWPGRIRPVLNLVTPVIRTKRLPDIGQPIKSAYLSFVSVANDDPVVFRLMLRSAIGLALEMGLDYLLAGFSVRDPLVAVARRFRHILYRSTMYSFTFDGILPPDAYDRSKAPYLEIAAL